MTKRQIKKAAYTAIVKENKSHQETFDALRKDSSIELETLAEEVSKIPSQLKTQKSQTLRYVFIAVLGLLIILRSLGIAAIWLTENIDMNLLLIAVLIGLIAPVVGIVGALTSRVENYRIVGILLALGILRSFTNGQMPVDPLSLLVLLPFVAAIILAFYIPTKLKTGYTQKVVTKEVDGKHVKSLQFIFDSSRESGDDELLDAEIG